MKSFPSFRSLAVAAGILAPVAGLTGCGPGINESWNGAGWYLEKPYLGVLGGPRYFGGPFSYEKCEEERIKLSPETASQMVCIRENRKPDKYGLY